MALPLSENMDFKWGNARVFFGYRIFEANAVDKHGDINCTEYINVAHDNVHAWSKSIHRAYIMELGFRGGGRGGNANSTQKNDLRGIEETHWGHTDTTLGDTSILRPEYQRNVY